MSFCVWVISLVCFQSSSILQMIYLYISGFSSYSWIIFHCILWTFLKMLFHYLLDSIVSVRKSDMIGIAFLRIMCLLFLWLFLRIVLYVCFCQSVVFFVLVLLWTQFLNSCSPSYSCSPSSVSRTSISPIVNLWHFHVLLKL